MRARAPALPPHHQGLELATIAALQRDDVMAAVEYADRRSRISPPPTAHSHVLYGEALFRAGDRRGAVAALKQALRLAPEDLAANRRMLVWAEGEASRDAAVVLVRNDRDLATLRRAIERLREDGRRDFASCLALDDEIHGWALWQAAGPATLTVSDGVHSTQFALHGRPSPDFPGMGAWINFRVKRPRSSRLQSMVVTVEDEILFSETAGPPQPDPRGPVATKIAAARS